MLGMTRHLTFANLASALALAVALTTGTAYAASQLPKNSVTGKQVKNHSLKAKDFAVGQLPAGPAGPAGPPAATLLAVISDTGAAGSASLVYGRGAVSVSDPAGDNGAGSPYVVTFDRNLAGCVALATPGRVNSTSVSSVAEAFLTSISGSTVLFAGYNGATQNQSDTSFQVAVFC
jgi:hypothetical protein